MKDIEKTNVKEKGKPRIVLTNGVFDILHLGHLELLKFAKSLGDKLIVAVNSDRSARELKGDGRPINSEQDRKKFLESLREVDEVVIFDHVEPLPLLQEIRPDVLVKGAEWTAEQARKRDKIPDEIKVIMAPLVNGYSTTSIIKKIKQCPTWEKKQNPKDTIALTKPKS
jgi:D-beta-D-heptose 7-phosphate kinase/D-beta-D-heptose 1-phosphate adenosyltransferase